MTDRAGLRTRDRRDSWRLTMLLTAAQHHAPTDRALAMLGESHGPERLTTAKWPDDEHDGWEMTAATAFILRAEGAYQAPIRSAENVQ